MPPFWYVAQVTPRHEKKVDTILGYKNYEHLVPTYKTKRRWSDRFKVIEAPLFPGYVFFRSERNKLAPATVIPGIIRIVSFGGMPTPVSDEEIDALRRISGSVRELSPFPYTTVGQKVTVVTGPLAGLTGIVTKTKGGRRLIVSVDAIAKSISVDVDAAEVICRTRAE